MSKKVHNFPDNTEERRAKRIESALRAWRATLIREPEVAEQAIKRVLGVLIARNAFMPQEIAQFYAQMKNGFAVPADFMPSTEDGMLRRA